MEQAKKNKQKHILQLEGELRGKRLANLLEDPSLVPCTHVGKLTTEAPVGSNIIFSTPQAPAYLWHSHTNRHPSK